MSKAQPKKTELEIVKPNALPAALAARVKADAGKGLSKEREDNMVPLVYVLQSGSPVVKKGNPNQIAGAEAGDLWLRNAPNPIVKGEEGILFQPCYFSKDWVEWQPDRGGFVDRHDELPPDAEKIEDPKNPNKVRYVRKNGNEVVETRYHTGFVLGHGSPQPFIIPLSGSGHSFSRTWMFMMNSKEMDGTIVPSWACTYRLKTRLRTNALGEWFVLTAEDAGYIETDADYDRGAKLNAAFASGAQKAEAPVVDGAAKEDEIPF